MKKKIENILKNAPMFDGFEIGEKSEIINVMDIITVKEGELLIRQNEMSSKFFIILSGHYLVYFKDDSSFILKEQGDFIGWSTLIGRSKYTASARALTKGELVVMKSSRFIGIMKQKPKIVNKIISNCKKQIEKRECKSLKEWKIK